LGGFCVAGSTSRNWIFQSAIGFSIQFCVEWAIARDKTRLFRGLRSYKSQVYSLSHAFSPPRINIFITKSQFWLTYNFKLFRISAKFLFEWIYSHPSLKHIISGIIYKPAHLPKLTHVCGTKWLNFRPLSTFGFLLFDVTIEFLASLPSSTPKLPWFWVLKYRVLLQRS
jgi:hypothetical protein